MLYLIRLDSPEIIMTSRLWGGWCKGIYSQRPRTRYDEWRPGVRVIINRRKVLLKTVCSFISRSALRDSDAVRRPLLRHLDIKYRH